MASIPVWDLYSWQRLVGWSYALHRDPDTPPATVGGEASPDLSDLIAELERKWETPGGPSLDPAAKRAAEVEAFVAGLAQIPWFANLGHPHPFAAGVVRMAGWDDWPGPDDPAVNLLCMRHQELYDTLITLTGAEALWEQVDLAVKLAAAPQVPYESQEDAWHGPTSAVWQAAWTAGLVALCLHTGRPVPPDLADQWQWFARGHWPAGYASLDEDGEPGQLLVY